MDRALIISGSDKSLKLLSEILQPAAISRITAVSTAGEARRLLIESDYDLCLINAPLPDEFGEGLARDIAERGVSEVILLVASDLYEEVSGQVEDYGVLTVSKPLNRGMLWNAVKVAAAAHKKLQLVHNQNRKLLQKIEDIRIVDRAKCMLISYLSMSEPEAHRYIEKQAMNLRTTKRAVAEGILRTYEN